jgi:hypothetical protein
MHGYANVSSLAPCGCGPLFSLYERVPALTILSSRRVASRKKVTRHEQAGVKNLRCKPRTASPNGFVKRAICKKRTIHPKRERGSRGVDLVVREVLGQGAMASAVIPSSSRI